MKKLLLLLAPLALLTISCGDDGDTIIIEPPDAEFPWPDPSATNSPTSTPKETPTMTPTPSPTPQDDNYEKEERYALCHCRGHKYVQLYLPEPALDAHLMHHKYDYEGECKYTNEQEENKKDCKY